MLSNIKSKVMRDSRERKIEQFYSLCPAAGHILDVGVSSESKSGSPARNYFLKTYRLPPHTYTGLGVQDLSGMEFQFPGKRFVTYGGGVFPFNDKQFDWVFSNAVIEHVGDTDDQVMFLNEMLRVGRRVFFTTPNKYFPVEAHTNILLLHWNNSIFYRWCSNSHPWVNRKSLNLLSEFTLNKIIRGSHARNVSVTANRLFALPMTFSVVCDDGSV